MGDKFTKGPSGKTDNKNKSKDEINPRAQEMRQDAFPERSYDQQDECIIDQLLDAVKMNRQKIMSIIHSIRHAESKKYNKYIDQLTEEARQENDQLEKERDNALYRLSQVMEARVKFNNTAITELGDQSSTEKIAEEFKNLYSKQHTDALDEIKNQQQVLEEQGIIGNLLFLLTHAFQFCRETAAIQLKRMQLSVTDPFYVEVSESTPQDVRTTDQDTDSSTNSASSLPEFIIKQLNDARKTKASSMTDTVCKTFLEKIDISRLFGELESLEKTKEFIRKSVELCWLMGIQDPQLVLYFHCQKNEVLNKNYFCTYRNEGEIVEYMVWPALMLSEKGQVLARGIAEVKSFDE